VTQTTPVPPSSEQPGTTTEPPSQPPPQLTEPRDQPPVKVALPSEPSEKVTPGIPQAATPRQLAEAALAARGNEQIKLLQQLSEGKGNEYTEALAWATAQLTGAAQVQARDLMTQRMCRMTVATLRAKLADPHPEVRRAAALAFATREDRSSLGEIVVLLEDRDPLVVRAARTALRHLTGQDFGPEPNATPTQRTQAVAAWRDWLNRQRGR
jgi:HEAT repeat protein